MTDFYASKLRRKVEIPDSKVCGAKFANDWAKSGYSCAVKAGADNGVVPQRLSRFATMAEAFDKHPCRGNTNWMNHRPGDGFKDNKVGPVFSLDRPRFIAAEQEMERPEVGSIAGINHRRGMGNREIVRPALDAPPIEARAAKDFEALHQNEVSDKITKVGLDQATLDKLFGVRIPDPLDTSWLDEKRRRIADYLARGMTQAQAEREVEVNKPLGREQRTTAGQRNIGQSELSMSKKLQELKEEIADGKAVSIAQQAALMGQFALVLADTNAINALTQTQLTNLGADLQRINVPRNHKAIGLPHRFIGIDEYKANAGLVNFYLLSQSMHTPGLDLTYPVFNFAVAPPSRILLQSAISSMGIVVGGHHVAFLDLEAKGMVNQNMLRAAAAARPNGWADPDLSVIPLADQ